MLRAERLGARRERSEIGAIIVAALGGSPDIAGLAARTEALCERRPLYPGFRGYPTYAG